MGWCVDVEFRESPIHGTGAFALESIPAGTKVWTFDETMHVCGPAELGALEPESLHFALHGGYFHFPAQKFVWYTDGMQFVNHAPGARSNVGIREWTPLQQDNCTALRDIEAGEELLEDYNFWSIFNLEPAHWLHAFYQDFCPEHYRFLLRLYRARQAA